MKIDRTDLLALMVIGLSGGAAFVATAGLAWVGEGADHATVRHIESGQPGKVIVERTRPEAVQVESAATEIEAVEEASEAVGSTTVTRAGEAAVFRIRAESTVEGEPRIRVIRSNGDASQPLIYVDGIRVAGGNMPELSPDVIERVEVIKGEAAVELYGEEAANGVVQIFLKSSAAENPGH